MSLAGWFAAGSAAIVIVAGLVASFVQRARYLRDTVPVLRVTGAPGTRVSFLNFLVTCHLNIEVHNDSDQIIFVDSPHILRTVTGSAESIINAHSAPITRIFDTNLKLYAGDSGSSDSFEDWEVPFDQPEVDPIDVKIYALLSWRTEFDILTALLLPFSRGRRQFDRIVELSATYVATPNEEERFKTSGFTSTNIADEFAQSFIRETPTRLSSQY